jgi:antitoxin CcdA
MLDLTAAPKKATNLTLNTKTLEMARSLGINVSQTVDVLLAAEIKRIYWERWNAENKDAIDHYNARIAAEGTFAQQVNQWLAEQGEDASGKAA